jgi:hypothetical protein
MRDSSCSFRSVVVAIAVFVTVVLLSSTARLASAELRAGASTADITPPVGGQMYGYGARGTNVSTGVHDKLHAKALVLSNGTTHLAIVSLDLGSITAGNTAVVRKIVRAETPIEHVLLVASHTHSSPRFAPDFPSKEKPYVSVMERAVARAIVEAYRKLEPARIGVASGRVAEGHNRRKVLKDGTVKMLWGNRERAVTSPVDYSLTVIGIDSVRGPPIATLVNFACHPVVLGPENLEISADYPGVMKARVERDIGGECLFVQGAAGDINPFWDKTPPAEGGFEQVRILGEALGKEAVRVRRSISRTETSPAISVVRQGVRLKSRWDFGDPEVRAAVTRSSGTRVFKYYVDRFERERDVEVHTVLVGSSLALAFFPGEFFVEHGLRLKKSSVIENTVFVGYTNGAPGYFPTIRAAAQGGYGALEATIVEVGAGERLVDLALIRLHYQAGRLHRVPRF